jgi:non-specific serine/threonine protein kinase/serine/threonine-protein kinase
LRGEPVIAHRSTFFYRSTKFVRRHKLGFVTGLLMFAFVVTGVLTIVRAERKARRQQIIAERRFNDLRKVANSLIFEVHDSIRSLPGATAARKIILERAQEYLDSLAADSKSDPSLLRELSAAYIRIAAVLGNSRDANLGDSALSLQDYRRAVEMRETVVAALPSDREARRELAESDMALALALRGSREADAARRLLDKATAILEPLAAADTSNTKIQYALAKATEYKAGLYADQGEFKNAQTTYQKSLAMYQHVAEMDPSNRDYRIDVAYAHKHVGGTLIVQKQLQPALEEYRAALVIDEGELKADPRDASIRYNITFTYSDTGYILGQQGKIDEALGYYNKALVIRRNLAEADPQDRRSRGGLANTYSYIGGLLWKKGDQQGSLEAHKKALALREALSVGDPSNEPKRVAVAQSQAEIGEAYASMAFNPHADKMQRLLLCRKAESFLQPTLPIFVARKGKLFGSEAENLGNAQKAADRCNVTISRSGTLKKNAAPVRLP